MKINTIKTIDWFIKGKTKPFGIEWPNEPIKDPGFYFTYDLKLFKEKNSIERLDSIRELLNVWSSVYGNWVIIKRLLLIGTTLRKFKSVI